MLTLPSSDANWHELLSAQRDPEHADLATRLIVGHLRQSVRLDTVSLNAALEELYHYHTIADAAERDRLLHRDPFFGRKHRPFEVQNLLLSVPETLNLINTGVFTVIAGPDELLATLPCGNWIGGTTAYIMPPKGHAETQGRLMCSVLQGADCRIAVLAQDDVSHITDGRYESGFTYLLLPGLSKVLRKYALQAPGIPGLFDQPLFGWVTGVHMSEVGDRVPRVFDGRTSSPHENAAVVLYVKLPLGSTVNIDLVNPYTQGRGPDIVFPETGFSGGACMIDGRPANFAQYTADEGIDTSMPLVANYAGALINVSIRAVNTARGYVQFFAPVVAGERYRVAEPRPDYERCITACARSLDRPELALICRCILNHLNPALASADTAGFVGPVTFGEIAYILLNQTFVVLNGEGRGGHIN